MRVQQTVGSEVIHEAGFDDTFNAKAKIKSTIHRTKIKAKTAGDVDALEPYCPAQCELLLLVIVIWF